jgi:hypothetical protein
MTGLATLPSIVMTLLATNVIAAGADAILVENTLRMQGLQPGKQPPEEQGDWGYEVRGTAENLLFKKTDCYPFPVGRTSFEGARFSFISDDRGEWGGKLIAREGKTHERILIDENVIDMIPMGSRLYVFTGSDHGSLDYGAVHVIEDYDSRPRARLITLLPGTPRAVTLDSTRGGFLVVTRLSLTLVRTSSDTIDVLMARHASLPAANSVLSVSKSEILIGICGGVAEVQLPWHTRPPDAEYNIPIVTYWTRQ